MLLLCSVCDEISSAEHADGGHAIRFSCRHCGDFSISDTSAIAIQRFKPEMRRNVLRLAAHRAGPANVPHISHLD